MSALSADEENKMKLALELASSARGQTSPNPLVGAVVVKNGDIVGMGAHLRAGTPHAEVHAIAMAGEQASGSTVYVTLEPCSHYGRTPPCADLLVRSGVKRVVIALEDPNPLVAGRGIRKLRDAGIEVTVGIMEAEARRLNEEYITFITKKRPFTLVKTATTLDGRIATSTGDSKWISTDVSRQWVHSLRAEYPCIVVGKGTVLADDPLLTSRLPGSPRQPLRLVVDSLLRLPLSAKLFNSPEAKAAVACTEHASAERMRQFADQGVEILVVPGSSADESVKLPALWHLLGQRGIAACLVEGGGRLIGSLLQEKLVDKWMNFINPKLIGGNGPASIAGWEAPSMQEALSLQNVEVARSGEDIVVTGYVS